MTVRKDIKVKDISKGSGPMIEVDPQDLLPLPAPYDKWEELPGIKRLKESDKKANVVNLDGYLIGGLPKPETKEEEQKIVNAFIEGVKKLFTAENNWTFLQPLVLSMEHCAQCQSCSEQCPVYEESGGQEIYRPTFRAEVLRKLYFKYVKGGNKLVNKFQHGDIEVNWTLISRLYELSYRCTLCRRCASACPISVDNGLISRELRKLFSQELGFYTRPLHEKGTVQHLEVGSSTGMNDLAVKDNLEFIDEDISDRTGFNIKTEWDKTGADILVIHNAGEILAWPDNPGAFAVLLEAAGYSWTMSSEVTGYDGVNYGLFYDDIQYARIYMRHMEIAKKLGVKMVLMGECGHESKAMAAIGDRVDSSIPRVPAVSFIRDIVFSGKIKFDPERNNFPVTLHDPCNMVRSMGLVEPQREVLRYLAPKFREMYPHGVDNYCCGGGSGFAIMQQNNFADWRLQISGRKKLRQILEAFANEDPSPDVPKYVCAPCSNCKGQIRDLLEFYGVTEKNGIYYDGLVELVVNAMVDIKEPFINFENR
jgi:Fe-S oxidoreductase